MTFKEQWNLWFHKNECVRIEIVDLTNTIHTFIKRLSLGDKTVQFRETAYSLESDKIYYKNGLKTLSYHITNAKPIDWSTNNSDDFSSEHLKKIGKLKIVKDLVETAEEEGLTLKSIIFLAMAIVIVALGIGLYLVYQEVQSVNEYIEQNKDVIELIKDYLLQNGGN